MSHQPMRRRYDSSAASSLYSHTQPVTRASSATAVATVDDVFGPDPDPYYAKYDGLKDSRFVEDRSIDVAELVARTTSVPGGSQNGSYDPYYALQRGASADAPVLARRKTAKELISRYESMSQATASPGDTSSVEFPKRAKADPPPAQEKKGKGRSPIRHSFRNLLSVFSKKKAGKDNASLAAPPEQDEGYGIAVEVRHPEPLHLRSVTDLSLAETRSLEPACTTPVALYAGPLLHLCRTGDGSLPVWTECNVILHPSHILVTWLTSSGNPFTEIVTFEGCTDVRSLTLADLNSDERSLLPSDPDADFKPFELLFEGKPREKFVAASVKGRARWVSAIWDVVLKNEDRPVTYSPSLANPHSTMGDSRRSSPQPSSRYSEAGSNLDTTSRVSVSMDRELPSLPPSQRVSPSPSPRSPRYELYDPPVPKPTPQTPQRTPTKSTFLSPPPMSRPQSPSIRNLDQRSVVKQRLADIQRTESQRSTPTSEKSTRSRQIVRTPTSSPMRSSGSRDATPTPTLSVRTAGLDRKATMMSVAGESIIDSYTSPRSAYAGPLSSIPSGQSLKDLTNTPTRVSANDLPPSFQPFSPTSRYGAQTRAPSLTAASFKLPVPPTPKGFSTTREPSFGGQTRSMFVHPPPTEDEIVIPIPRAAELRMTIEQDKRIAGLQEQLKDVQDGLANTHDERMGLHAELTNVQMELQRLPQAVKDSVADRTPRATPAAVGPAPAAIDEDTKLVLGDINESVRRIEDQAGINGQGLKGIHAKVDAIMAMRKEESTIPATGESAAMGEAISSKLEEVRADLKNEFPLLAQKLEDILGEKLAKMGPRNSTVMGNVAPKAEQDDTSPASDANDEVAAIRAKLDQLLALHKNGKEEANSGDESGDDEHAKLEEVLELLKGDQAQRTQQMEQQTDNARYLNELNSWLETFVTHGTSQIEAVASGVQQLYSALGPFTQSEQVGPDGQPVVMEQGGLLGDVRHLLLENKERSEGDARLGENVQGLMAAIQEDLARRGAEAQTALTAEHVVGLIDQQRQDQERMLRSLATELSNDIRGERLRFVEAMKEATTINVQIHVEEFKKELTREVLAMTQEVARLQKERQTLEQHIAELFAFYARQKQNGEQKQAAQRQRRAAPQQGQGQQQYGQGTNNDQQQQGARRPLPSVYPRGMPGGM